MAATNLTNELTQRATDAETKLADLQAKMSQIAEIMSKSGVPNTNTTTTTITAKAGNKNSNDDLKTSDQLSYEPHAHAASTQAAINTKGLKFYYWPLKNRGNFGRFILAESGVDYEEITDGATVVKYCKCRNAMEYDNNNNHFRFDAFAPPFLFHNNKMISQTTAVVLYLAELTGLRPKSNLDNAEAVMIVQNIGDACSELSDNGGKSKEGLAEYLDGRFIHFMDILSKPLKHGGKVYEYYFDDKITYADLSLVNMLDGFREIFPKFLYDKYITSRYEILDKMYQSITHRANIKRLLTKQKQSGMEWYPDSYFKDLKTNLNVLSNELEAQANKEKNESDAAASKDSNDASTTDKQVAA